jgi:hypothetical protein
MSLLLLSGERTGVIKWYTYASQITDINDKIHVTHVIQVKDSRMDSKNTKAHRISFVLRHILINLQQGNTSLISSCGI